MIFSHSRFCSQPYKVEDFHESIHLCNNAIQQKYKNGERSSNLPEENMWDNDTFINYLRQVRSQAGLAVDKAAGVSAVASLSSHDEIFSDWAARGVEQHRLSRHEEMSHRVSSGNSRFG